jgi:molybdopterin converting factor small subunit
MQIQVQLFGAFRDLEPSGRCQIEYQNGQTAEQIKVTIGESLHALNSKVDLNALLKVSAIGSEDKVYADDEIVGRFATLAILPPVCGG